MVKDIGRYTIRWVGGETSSGYSYCFECGESVINDSVYSGDLTRVQRLNSGADKYICKNCGKEFGPYDHVTVITDEFI